MGVPCGDQRDWQFATHFNIDIINIFRDIDIKEHAYEEKDFTLVNSDFLDGLQYDEATKLVMTNIIKEGFGNSKVNYRLRDAVFSRQRYWGSPFPYIIKITFHICLMTINMSHCL